MTEDADALVRRVGAAAGRPVAALETIPTGGYSNALRRRVRFADGGAAFVKVAVSDPTADWLRAEHRMYAALAGAPFLAEMQGFDDDGHRPLIVLEDLSDADWPPPWDDARVRAVVDAWEAIGRTPAPPGLPHLETFRDEFCRWSQVAQDPAPFLEVGLCDAAWLERALPRLRDAEAALDLSGDRLLHLDLRSDNLCFRPDGRCVVVDWNWACVGNPWMDLGAWLPSLHAEGGPSPETLWESDAAAPVAATLAGFFGAQAGLPPPDGAPRVREVQRRQLATALPWAARTLGLPEPVPARGPR